jgi:hypothetical protein
MSWVAIEGYEGRYCISDEGDVMSMDYKQTGLPGILKPGYLRGYLSVELYDADGVGKRFTVHRLVAHAFIGPRPKGMQINHKDGVKSNNAASNLEYCTGSENMKHAFVAGLQSNKGERHSQAQLTDDGVRQIRRMLAQGLSQEKIAMNFGIYQSVVSRIKSGKAWGHVTGGVL